MQIGIDAKNMKVTRKDRHNKSKNINRLRNKTPKDMLMSPITVYIIIVSFNIVLAVFLVFKKKFLVT